MKNKIFGILLLFALMSTAALTIAQTNVKSATQLARVKYKGGGDWYNDPSAEVNLLRHVGQNTNIKVNPTYVYVDLASDNLFLYPLIFLTGHGNLNFSDEEVLNLRAYLQNGGFLYIDDDYGLDKYIRTEMKKIFPNQEFAELPFTHGIYSSHYKFPNGLPKIHKHDDKVPQGYGLFHNKRMCVYYTFECNLADGWTDADIHNDSEKIRENSLKMGTNIIVWALTH